MMLFGSTLATFTDVFSVVDFETPHSYNLGRNVATTIVFSKHHELMIKTITGTNFKHFKRVFFRDYFALVESNPNTLIAKIYGVFSIEQPESKTPVHLVLMENLFHPTFGGQVEMVFDLKGASVNRHHSEFKQLIEQ
jgi:1-phosphatidylinositol-4-phosphate 5-kinase